MSVTFTQLTTGRGLSRAVIASALLASAVVVWGGYTSHWSWTGLTQNGTLWDWLKLLALPLSLAALPLWLQSHRHMSVIWRWILAAVAVAFGILVLLGYSLHWTWTGFAGNTLWDWLELLLLPIVIATVKFWTAEHSLQARHWIATAVVMIGFAAFAACAYLLPITWSGFVGNTMWDWIKLLFIPILMPLVLVPAVTDWMSAGIREQTEDAEPTADAEPTDEAHPAGQPALHGYSSTSYEIWLSPTEKITAEVRPPADPADSPQLIVNEAVTVHRLTATAN
jgi:hypothetical protein